MYVFVYLALTVFPYAYSFKPFSLSIGRITKFDIALGKGSLLQFGQQQKPLSSNYYPNGHKLLSERTQIHIELIKQNFIRYYDFNSNISCLILNMTNHETAQHTC
jgi:hypothetical protein